MSDRTRLARGGPYIVAMDALHEACCPLSRAGLSGIFWTKSWGVRGNRRGEETKKKITDQWFPSVFVVVLLSAERMPSDR